MSIFLIRHGETALNAARVLQPANTPLNERGVAQAEALARRLATLGVAAILSSDLPRARTTAEAIAAATGAPVTTTDLLQERNFGHLRGLAYDSLPTDPLRAAAAPPGGESLSAFEARCAAAFAQIAELRARTDGNLAVVTHGLVIGMLLARRAASSAVVDLPTHLGNTSLTVLSPTAPHTIERVNCTLHLDALSGDDARALSGG